MGRPAEIYTVDLEGPLNLMQEVAIVLAIVLGAEVAGIWFMITASWVFRTLKGMKMPDSHLEAAYEERSELPDVYDDELEDQEDCDICGESLDRQEYGEFYNPDDPYPSKHYIAHADCGLSAGYELA